MLFNDSSIELSLLISHFAKINARINVTSPGRGRPGIGGGFDSSHCLTAGTFDRFNGLSSNTFFTITAEIHTCSLANF